MLIKKILFGLQVNKGFLHLIMSPYSHMTLPVVLP